MSERNFQVALPVCSGWPNITVPLCPAGLGRSLSVFRAQTCGSRQLRVSATVVACLRIDDNGNAAKCSSCRDRRTVVWLLHKKRSNMSILLVVYHKLQLVYMLLIFTKGRVVQPKQMNFRKSSKWSLTPPPPPLGTTRPKAPSHYQSWDSANVNMGVHKNWENWALYYIFHIICRVRF